MNTDFTRVYTFEASPASVYNTINDVRSWWSEDFAGASTNIGDEFDVNFSDIHYSKQRITVMEPNRRVDWLIVASKLTFLENMSEWNGTTVSFNIDEAEGKTRLTFIHHGLVPEAECYTNCSKGWTYYLEQSLVPLIRTGAGAPNKLPVESAK
jgi:hypothetical protein